MNWKEIEEAYISGQIDETEKEKLLNSLEDDNAKIEINLSDDLDSIMAGNSGAHSSASRKMVEQHIDDAVSKKIKETLEKERNKKKSILRPLYLAVSAAAAVALFFIIPLFSGVDSDKLFANYSQGENMPSLIERSGEESIGSMLESAYLKEDYDTVISLFTETDDASTVSGAIIFTAMSYAHIGHYQDAHSTIDLLINSAELIDAPKGQFYKGLISLKEGNVEESKDIFNLVIEQNLPGVEAASGILNKLK